MAKTLTELIADVQAQLMDDGTLFTTATCTAAIRQALRDFNQHAPVNNAEILEVDSSLKTYELAGSSFTSVILDIIDVLKNDDQGEDDQPLEYDKIFEDNRAYVRLRTAESSGNLLIRYTSPHTVSGLDSATESTLNTDQDQVLVDGACGYACSIRAIGRIEANNLDRAAISNYEKAALKFFKVFEFGISRYANRPEPKAERRTTSWLTNDIALRSSSQAGTLKDL